MRATILASPNIPSQPPKSSFPSKKSLKWLQSTTNSRRQWKQSWLPFQPALGLQANKHYSSDCTTRLAQWRHRFGPSCSDRTSDKGSLAGVGIMYDSMPTGTFHEKYFIYFIHARFPTSFLICYIIFRADKRTHSKHILEHADATKGGDRSVKEFFPRFDTHEFEHGEGSLLRN